MEGKLRFRAP